MSLVSTLGTCSSGLHGVLCLSTAALMGGRSASVLTGQAYRKYSGAGGVQRSLCSFQCCFWPAQGREEGREALSAACMLEGRLRSRSSRGSLTRSIAVPDLLAHRALILRSSLAARGAGMTALCSACMQGGPMRGGPSKGCMRMRLSLTLWVPWRLPDRATGGMRGVES
jgi:hypothetical protein